MSGWIVRAPHKTMYFKPEEYDKAYAKFNEWSNELKKQGYVYKGSDYATCVDDPKEYSDCFLCPDGKIEYLTHLWEMCGFERGNNPFDTIIED